MAERSARGLSRPYYYGSTRMEKTVHAYAEEEWGIGASSGGGDGSTIRSFCFSLITTVFVLLPVTLVCVVMVPISLFELSVMTLVFLFFGLLFGAAVVQGYFNIAQERRGRKARKCKGLPKPRFTVHDDLACEWFLAHPSPHVPLTLEYFPESRSWGQRPGRMTGAGTETIP